MPKVRILTHALIDEREYAPGEYDLPEETAERVLNGPSSQYFEAVTAPPKQPAPSKQPANPAPTGDKEPSDGADS